ncbi:MAG: ATP-binding cassette domain-containing protein [Acidobacteriaceae bacterium]
MPIEYSGVTFTYLNYDTPAVSDIQLEIQEGTITALIGKLGSGKSTLLRMMNGIVPNHFPGHMTGKVLVDGVDTQTVEVPEIAKTLNMVFDDPVLQIVSLTVFDDVMFGPANLGIPREEILTRVSEALHATRLNGYESRNPRTLSGGEQQLLAIAGVLAMKPKYLVLDEPIAMLDPLGKQQVLSAVRQMHAETGLTVVIAESGTDIESMVEFIDRAVILDQGRIVADGNPSELFSDKVMVKNAGLRVPQVTELAYRYANSTHATVPVTLDDGVEFVRQHDPHPNSSKIQAARDSQPSPSGAERIVSVSNLWHTFPGPPPVDALQGINLEINRGEMVALLGQNGSGKTTLAFHLVGALKPTNKDASIHVAGLDVIHDPQFEVIKRANYVFQNPANQLFNETFEKEVKYGPERLGLPPEEIEQRAKQALEKVGLGYLWEHSTFNIPKSLETLLGLASVLSIDPEVLIIDEPTGGLDLETGQRVMDTLCEINRHQKTIIIITHDMALASRYTRRAVVLHRGKILIDGPTREVFSQPEILGKTMLEPPQITRLGQLMAQEGFPGDILTVDEFAQFIPTAGRGRGAGAMSIFTYQDLKTPIHKLNALTKWCILITLTLLCGFILDPVYKIPLGIIIIIYAILVKLNFRAYRNLILLVFFSLLLANLLSSFFIVNENMFKVYDKAWVATVVFQLTNASFPIFGEMALTYGGILWLLQGALTGVFVVILLAAHIQSTSLNETVQALSALKAPFPIIYITMVALRFTPELAAQFTLVHRAQTLRGWRVNTRNPIKIIRLYAPLMLPVVRYVIKSIDITTMSTQNRAFGLGPVTNVIASELSAVDKALIIFTWVAFAVMMVLILRFNIGNL